MATRRLGNVELADAELKQGQAMVDDYFSRKLELGNDQTGRVGGWIMNPIFLREAERLVSPANPNPQ
jgi:hypothetical protein